MGSYWLECSEMDCPGPDGMARVEWGEPQTLPIFTKAHR